MKNYTINQVLDRLLDKVTLDQINADEELQYIYQRLVEKKSIYGGNHQIIFQGELLKLVNKHLPVLIT